MKAKPHWHLIGHLSTMNVNSCNRRAVRWSRRWESLSLSLGKNNIDRRPHNGPDHWVLLCAAFSLWFSVLMHGKRFSAALFRHCFLQIEKIARLQRHAQNDNAGLLMCSKHVRHVQQLTEACEHAHLWKLAAQ